MRRIDKVTIGSHVFSITQEVQDGENGIKQVTFFADQNGQRKKLELVYTTEAVNVLAQNHNIDMEEELAEIAEQEIKSELFEAIHNVKLADVLEGKHPQLLAEYITSGMDISYITAEAQYEYADLIAESLIGKL